jgi:large subunit ribosomal protein L9
MKIILTKDVPNLGHKDDVKDVKPGYAHNVLFKQGLATEASEGEIQKIKAIKHLEARREEEKEGRLNSIIDSLNGKIFELKVPASDQGHLFSKLKLDDVIKAVGSEEARELINLHEIKELGEHQIKIENGKRKGVFTLRLA